MPGPISEIIKEFRSVSLGAVNLAMREFQSTKIDGRIYLFPVPVSKERKYLIFCSSDDEASFILRVIREKKVTHPDLVSGDFIFLTYHSDKQTKIYVINPSFS
jgi:hypothetical protein